MKTRFGHASRREEGQVLVLFAVSIVAFLAFAAFAIDFGFILHAYSELQASTNAAATAGALELPNTDALTVATNYSGLAGDKNADGDLTGVTMMTGSPEARCLQYMVNLGLSCDNAMSANSVQVAQQVSVPTFFAKVIGINSITLKASALASMKGGTSAPGNIMLVMDTTASMNDRDSDPNCKTATGIANPTQLDCAKWGARVLFQSMSPCAANLSSCGTVSGSSSTGYNVPNAVEEVGLLTFPGLLASSDAAYDYQNCGTGMASKYISQYAGPPTTSPPYFTIVQPSSNYKTSDSGSLNGSSSNLIQAVDWQDGNNCTASQYGLQALGGEGTYYAGIIAEAQTDLSALSAPRSSMQSAIILLSDGAANSTWNSNGCNGNPANCDYTSGTTSTYGQNDCHQAVSAAQRAAATKNAAGLTTWVYAVGFGALTSTSSCPTDSPAISPCATLSGIASDATKFYSDDANGCSSPAHSNITSLSAIFQAIGGDFKTTRLLPIATQ
jgi:Flp pilus assembly protein TadG